MAVLTGQSWRVLKILVHWWRPRTNISTLFWPKNTMRSLVSSVAQASMVKIISSSGFPISLHIYPSGFHTRCLYWVSRRSSPRSHYSTSPPMKLVTSQSLPQSSAISVMIMNHHIDLADFGHEKLILWLCTAFWHKALIKVTKPLLPTPLVFRQNKEATHPRIGPTSITSKTTHPTATEIANNNVLIISNFRA